MVYEFTADQFAALGWDFIKKDNNGRPQRERLPAQQVLERKFLAFFGTTAFVCALLWAMLLPQLPDLPSNVHPKHLLWALIFLKQYNIEEVNAKLAACDEKTFRKWVWLFVEMIAELESNVVSSATSRVVILLISSHCAEGFLTFCCCRSCCSACRFRPRLATPSSCRTYR